MWQETAATSQYEFPVIEMRTAREKEKGNRYKKIKKKKCKGKETEEEEEEEKGRIIMAFT